MAGLREFLSAVGDKFEVGFPEVYEEAVYILADKFTVEQWAEIIESLEN